MPCFSPAVSPVRPATVAIQHLGDRAVGFPAFANRGDEFPVLPQRNEVKIESITMDLEEMKDFLFMMIRGGAVRSESDGDTVGRIVNKFA